MRGCNVRSFEIGFDRSVAECASVGEHRDQPVKLGLPWVISRVPCCTKPLKIAQLGRMQFVQHLMLPADRATYVRRLRELLD